MTLIYNNGKVKAYWDGKYITFQAGATIDADGAPNCYHPTDNSIALDYLANAGHPGNWWGIATNSQGKPYVQKESDPCPGFYVSTTALQRHNKIISDPIRYINSSEIPYISIPLSIAKKVGPIVLGCKCEIFDPEEGWISGVVADFGGEDHIGEISIKYAKKLGIPSDSKHGGTNTLLKYRITPGEQVTINGETFKLQALK